RSGGFAGSADVGFAQRRARIRTVGGLLLRRVRSEPVFVRVLSEFLALNDTSVASRLQHDAANVVVEYLDSGHGAGRVARPRVGALFHDVHGHGSIWSAEGVSAGRQ